MIKKLLKVYLKQSAKNATQQQNYNYNLEKLPDTVHKHMAHEQKLEYFILT